MDAYFTAVWTNSGSQPVTIDDLGVAAGGRMSVYRHVTYGGILCDELVEVLEAPPRHLGNPSVTINPGRDCNWMAFPWPGARKAPAGSYVARLEKPQKAQSNFVVGP
jgi:hypothetical protein